MAGFTSFTNLKSEKVVMVVEDEILTRDSFAHVVESYFENVYYAEDGVDGLEMFYRVNPDIIFTDIVMPKMNGIEMLKQIKTSIEQMPTTIIFSAFDTSISEKDLENIGIYKKIIKPFKMKELEDIMSELKTLDLS